MSTPQDMTRTLDIPLPENIAKKKWAGDLTAAQEAVEARLSTSLPELLRQRLLVERERLRHLSDRYPWSRQEAQRKLNELLPAVTWEQFDQLEAAGRIDFLYVNGEKRYFDLFHKVLVKFPDLLAPSGKSWSPASPWLDPMIAEIREKGILSRRITLRTRVWVEPDSFMPGEYLAHLPFPIPCAQQSDIELIDSDACGVNDADVLSRCLWWRGEEQAQRRYTATYRYTSTIRHADPLHRPAPASPLYPAELPPTPADLREEPPFLRFTPYLRSLAAEITQGCETPLQRAWAIFRWITEHIQYAYVRDYFRIDDLGEYCAVNQRGDCGLQALLFIQLCRICGIPARWQSGMAIDEDGGGSHDWAQFYLDGWGWLFADPSFGGAAWRNGNPCRRDFFFGNLDPMRMAANRAFQAPLVPEKTQLRMDPFDNQSGEIERIGADHPLCGREVDGEALLIACETLS